jgi:hypothetical protein
MTGTYITTVKSLFSESSLSLSNSWRYYCRTVSAMNRRKILIGVVTKVQQKMPTKNTSKQTHNWTQPTTVIWQVGVHARKHQDQIFLVQNRTHALLCNARSHYYWISYSNANNIYSLLWISTEVWQPVLWTLKTMPYTLCLIILEP